MQTWVYKGVFILSASIPNITVSICSGAVRARARLNYMILRIQCQFSVRGIIARKCRRCFIIISVSYRYAVAVAPRAGFCLGGVVNINRMYALVLSAADSRAVFLSFGIYIGIIFDSNIAAVAVLAAADTCPKISACRVNIRVGDVDSGTLTRLVTGTDARRFIAAVSPDVRIVYCNGAAFSASSPEPIAAP